LLFAPLAFPTVAPHIFTEKQMPTKRITVKKAIQLDKNDELYFIKIQLLIK
jgi:hypothetical protein